MSLIGTLRAEGLHVVEVPGWKTRGHGRMGKIQGVMIHHTAGPPYGNMPSLRTLVRGRRGLPGPLANFGLGRDGTVYVVAAGRAYHAGVGRWPGITSGNLHTLGIEIENDGKGQAYTASQLIAGPRLAAALCRYYGLAPTSVIGHYEWAPARKIDPKTWPGRMPAFRAAVRRERNGPPSGKPAGRVKRAISRAKARVSGKLVVDGKFGPRTVAELKKQTGAPSYAKWQPYLQRRLHVKVDGVIGPRTVRVLQHFIGARPIDGRWGSGTTAALQRALNRGAFK